MSVCGCFKLENFNVGTVALVHGQRFALMRSQCLVIVRNMAFLAILVIGLLPQTVQAAGFSANVSAMRDLATPSVRSEIGDPNLYSLTGNSGYGSFVNDPAFSPLMSDADFAIFMEQENIKDVFEIPNFSTLVSSGDFSLYFSDARVGSIVSSPYFTNLLANPNFVSIVGSAQHREVLSNPITLDLMRSSALPSVVQNPSFLPLLRNTSLTNFVAHDNLGVLVNSASVPGLLANPNFSRLLENPAMEQFVTNVNFSAVLGNSGFGVVLNSLSARNVIDMVGIGGMLANADLNNLLSSGELNSFIVRMNATGILSPTNLAGLVSNPNLSSLVRMPNLSSMLVAINVNGVLGRLNLSGLMANINLVTILGNPNLVAMLRLPNIGALLGNFNFMAILQNPSFASILNVNFLGILSGANFNIILSNLNIAGLLNFDLSKIFNAAGTNILSFLSNPNLNFSDLAGSAEVGSMMDAAGGVGGAGGNGGSYNNDDCNCCVNPGGMLGQMIKSILQNNFLKEEIVQDDLKPANQTLADSLREKIILRFLMIGAFMDGQTEVQSVTTLQKLNAKAMRDYQVSEQICRFGSISKGLSQSSNKAKAAEQSIMNRMVARQTLDKSTLSSVFGDSTEGGRNGDKSARLKRVATRYCDPQEMNGNYAAIATEQGKIVTPFCTSTDPKNWNADIDAGKTLFAVNSTGSSLAGFGRSDDEQNLIDLGSNLYANNLPLNLGASDMMRIQENGSQGNESNITKLMDMRSILAKHSVAAGSFAAIAGMKTAGSADAKDQLQAVAKELGVTDQKDLDALIGDNPSYYAQMDFLTKKLYQTPGFYANLYDTPSNVLRQQTALKAISLMQDRDIYESLQRSEMILSVILEAKIAHLQAKYTRNRK